MAGSEEVGGGGGGKQDVGWEGGKGWGRAVGGGKGGQGTGVGRCHGKSLRPKRRKDVVGYVKTGCCGVCEDISEDT